MKNYKGLVLLVFIVLVSCQDDQVIVHHNLEEIGRKLNKLTLNSIPFAPHSNVTDSEFDCVYTGMYSETFMGVTETVTAYFFDKYTNEATTCETNNKEFRSFPFEYNIKTNRWIEAPNFTFEGSGYENIVIEEFPEYDLGSVYYTYTGILNFDGAVFNVKEGSFTWFVLRSYIRVFDFRFEDLNLSCLIEFESSSIQYHFEIIQTLKDLNLEEEVVLEYPLYDSENSEIGTVTYVSNLETGESKFELYSLEGNLIE